MAHTSLRHHTTNFWGSLFPSQKSGSSKYNLRPLFTTLAGQRHSFPGFLRARACLFSGTPNPHLFSSLWTEGFSETSRSHLLFGVLPMLPPFHPFSTVC